MKKFAISLACATLCSCGGQSSVPGYSTAYHILTGPALTRARTTTQARNHYLYAVNGGASLFQYQLPFTNGSSPIAAVSGFTQAKGVAAGPARVVVADESANTLTMLTAVGLTKKCSFAGPGTPIGIALDTKHIFVGNGGQGAPIEVAQYANSCSKTSPLHIEPASAQVLGIAEDTKFVYASEQDPGLDVYSKPFGSSGATEYVHKGAEGVAITATDLYVGYGDTVVDYALPFTPTETPITVTLPQCGQSPFAYGVATDAAAAAPNPPTTLFVSDPICGYLYAYALPLSAGESPSVSRGPGFIYYGLATN